MRLTVSKGWTVTVFGTTARNTSPAPETWTGSSQPTAVSDTTSSALFISARRQDSLCMNGMCLLLFFSVTAADARVGEGAPRDGDELPGVGTGRQRELQHAERRAVEQLAVRQRCPLVVVMALAARADHELPNPSSRIRRARGRLRCEALVVVLVPVEHDVGPGVVQRLPQRLRRRQAAVLRPRAEPRMVPVGDGALLGAGREVLAQPRFLRRAGTHGGVAVQGDEVPGAEVIAVVALPRRAGERYEIAVVARRTSGVVVVVPRGRTSARLVAPPRRIVALRELRVRAVGVHVVAGREDRAGDVIEQRGGRLVAAPRAVGNIPCADEHDGATDCDHR